VREPASPVPPSSRAASLEGAFQEGGALWTAAGGNTLQLNNYSHNRYANTLYL